MSRGEVMLQVFNPRIQWPFLAVNAGAAAWYGEVAFLIPALFHLVLMAPACGSAVRYQLRMMPVIDYGRAHLRIKNDAMLRRSERDERRPQIADAESKWDAYYRRTWWSGSKLHWANYHDNKRRSN